MTTKLLKRIMVIIVLLESIMVMIVLLSVEMISVFFLATDLTCKSSSSGKSSCWRPHLLLASNGKLWLI